MEEKKNKFSNTSYTSKFLYYYFIPPFTSTPFLLPRKEKIEKKGKTEIPKSKLSIFFSPYSKL